MSTERPTIKIAEPAGGWPQPWPQAFEVAHALPVGSWTLVGGLMVQLHAIASAIPLSRPTTDVDAALHLETGVVSYAEAAAALRGIGYVPDEGQQHAYRFMRSGDIVDAMVADHLAPSHRPRYGGREVFAIEGGTQALQRTVNADIALGNDSLRLSVPNLHGALVLKGAAILVDSRDRGRHASDAITLLACLDEVTPIVSSLAGSDAQRLRAIVRALESDEPWGEVHADTARFAEPMLAALRDAL